MPKQICEMALCFLACVAPGGVPHVGGSGGFIMLSLIVPAKLSLYKAQPIYTLINSE